MGNKVSATMDLHPNDDNDVPDPHSKYRSFPGSAMLEKTLCGSIDTTDPTEYRNVSTVHQLLQRAEILCVSSPVSDGGRSKRYGDDDDSSEDENSIRETASTAVVQSTTTTTNGHHHNSLNVAESPHTSTRSVLPPPLTPTPRSRTKKTSKLLARALVSEVTDNPHTMKQADMQDRERRLLKAAAAAAKHDGNTKSNGSHNATTTSSHGLVTVTSSKPVGASAPPHMLRSMALACTGDENAVGDLCPAMDPPLASSANASCLEHHGCSEHDGTLVRSEHPHTVTIGVALSRQSPQGHAGTITRQTTYDWNQVQDRAMKYVSATSSSGWRGGGGEPNASQPDLLHIPILHLHCPTKASVEEVICVLASGEIFIPVMEILPEQVSTVHHAHSGLTDIVVTFGCERNDDAPVEEWPNWCLEFLHNQLYDYFSGNAAWMKRSFSVTLAQQVRWKTVKHMNRYFELSEQIVAQWRALGPQRLFPSASPQHGGASADEIARPHGIYLYQSGVPTNYFAPNFAPPYTTKMTRSLLMTVLQKSWDVKRREWSSRPVPRLAPPTTLISVACGYDPAGTTGYMAKEVTTVQAVSSTAIPAVTSDAATTKETKPEQQPPAVNKPKEPLSEVEFGRSASEDVSLKENFKGSMDEKASYEDSNHRKMGGSLFRVDHSRNNALHHTAAAAVDDGENTAVHSQYNASVADSGTTVLQSNLSQNRKPLAQPSTKNGSDTSHNGIEVAAAPLRSGHGPLYRDDGSLEEGSTFSDASNHEAASTIASPKWLQQTQSSREGLLQRERSASDYATSSGGSATAHKIMGSPVSLSSSPTKRAQFKMDRKKAATSNSPRANKGSSVEQSGSMEYSTDGSSAFFTVDAASLYGQHLASLHDGDATPNQQQQQQQRYVAAAAAAATKPLLEPMERKYGNFDDDDDESALLSLQESSSSSMQSVVPTDEELFSVGWAKALDPKSGSYYYFTLDRTRTIWENPLTSSQFGDELPPPVMMPVATAMPQQPSIGAAVPTTTRRVAQGIDP
jgi:hypothetical protein